MKILIDSMEEQNTIHRFADLARRYCEWVDGEHNEPKAEMITAQRLLADLYALVVVLPTVIDDSSPDAPDCHMKNGKPSTTALPYCRSTSGGMSSIRSRRMSLVALLSQRTLPTFTGISKGGSLFSIPGTGALPLGSGVITSSTTGDNTFSALSAQFYSGWKTKMMVYPEATLVTNNKLPNNGAILNIANG